MKPDAAPPPTDLLTDDRQAGLSARTRTLVGLTAAGWFFWALRGLFVSTPVVTTVAGTAALLTFATYLATRRMPNRSAILGHVNCAIATLFIFITSIVSGQIKSVANFYFICIPLCIGYLQGLRKAIFWAVICTAMVALTFILSTTAPIPPLYVISTHDLLISPIALIVLTVGLISGTEQVHAAHIATLKKRQATIDSLIADLKKKSEEAQEERDRAMAAANAKGDFVATLSHEIRTPLNGVLGMAGLLLDDEMAPDQRELVRTIRTSGDALLALLNDLLDFSKIEAGRLDLESTPFDLRDCAEDAFDLLGLAATEKRLRFAYVVAPRTVTRLLGDAGRVRQILVNLVSNAVKFTDEGEVIIELGSTPKEGGRHEISIAVRDTGIGIADEALVKLFQPFTQVGETTTRKVGGTGLGLAIVRKLSEAMGGRAWAESRLGFGSTFHATLMLPATDADLTGDSVNLVGKRFIVASDHTATRRMLMGQLAMLGAITTGCATQDEVVTELTTVTTPREPRGGAAPAHGYDIVIAQDSCAPIDLAGARFVRLLLPWDEQPPSGATLRTPVRRRHLERVLSTFWGTTRPVRSTPIPASARGDASSPRILVAEDNPVNQRVIRLMLERLGESPDLVGNGLEALHALHARRYDLVLMDVRMPEMDGLEATRALRRELAPDAQPVVVAMTANVQLEDRKACEEAGMNDFIPKPLKPVDVKRAVALVKKKRRGLVR